MGKVKVEIFPWLSEVLGHRGSGRLLWEEEISDTTTVKDLLAALAAKYKGFGETAYNAPGQRVSDHVLMVLNGRVLEPRDKLDVVLADGDLLTLLPEYAGG